MGRLRRGLKRGLGGLLVLVLLLLIGVEGAVLWLQTPSGNGWLRRQAERLVTEQMAEGELRIGEVDTDLFRHLELGDVFLDDGSGRPVVALDRLEVNWDASRLLGGEVVVARVVLDSPRVDLVTDEAGLLDVARLFPSDPDAPPSGPWEGLPVDLRLGELKLRNGSFSYADGETRVALEDLSVSLGARASGRKVSTEALVIEGQLTSPLELPVSARGQTRFTDGDVDLGGLVLAVGEDRLLLDGRVVDVEDPDRLALEGVTLRAAGLDLDRIEGWVGDLGLAGEIGLEADAAGPLSDLRLTALLETGGGEARVEGELDVQAELPSWSVRAETGGLELMGLVDAVTEPTALDVGVVLEGTGLEFPAGVEATAEVVARPSVLWGYPLDSATASLHWTEGRGVVDTFEGDMGWGSATGSGEVSLTGTVLDVRAEVRDLLGLEVFGVQDIGGVADGRGQLQIDWSGEEVEILFDGRARSHQVDVMGIVRIEGFQGPVHTGVYGTRVEASGRGDASGIDASGALVDRVAVSWRADVRDDGALRWEADVAGGVLDVAELVGIQRLHGRVSGEDDGLTEPRILARLVIQEVNLGALRGDKGQLTVSLQGDALEAALRLAEDDAERLSLRASGDLATGAYEVARLSLTPPEHAAWTNPEPLRVRVVEGGAEDIDVRLTSEAGRLAVSGHYLDGESVDLRAVVEGLQLDWIEAFVPETTGTWGGLAAASVRLRSDAEATTLAAHVAVSDLDIPGQVSGLDAEVDVTGEGESLDLKLRVADDDHLLARGGGVLPISIDLAAPGPVPEGSLSLEVQLAPWDLPELAERVPPLAALGDGQLSGALQVGGVLVAPEVDLALGLELAVGEPSQWMRVDLDLAEADGQISLAGEVRQAGRPQVLLDGSAVTELEQVLSGALVEGETSPDTSLTQTWVADLDVKLVPMNLDLASWMPALGLTHGVEGRLAGGVRVSGRVDRPQVAAGLQVADCRLGEVPVAPALVALAPTEDGYGLTMMLGTGEGSLQVGGRVPFDHHDPEPMDLDQELAREGLFLEVSGRDIPVALLQLFDPGIVEAEGSLEILGQVTGSVVAPDPVVSFELADAVVGYEPTGVRYSDLDLLAVLEHTDFSIEHGNLATEPLYLDARDALRGLGQRVKEGLGMEDSRVAQRFESGLIGEDRASRVEETGSMQLTGTAQVGLDGLTDVDLHLGSNFAWVMDTTEIEAAFTGDIDVSGDWPDLVFEGDIGLDKFRYALGARAYLGQEGLRLDEAVEIRRPGWVAVVPPPPEPEVWETWDIHSAIDLGFNTKVKVEVPLDTSYGTLGASASTVVFDAFVRGEVDARVKGADVYAEGAVETYEGTTRILGTTFGIEQGVVTFAGSDIANPALDIRAVHESQNYGDISVHITESVEAMQMRFDSERGWSELDIVSILFLGRPTTELSSAEGGGAGDNLNIALGMVAGQVEKLAGDNLVDTIEIETSEAHLEGVKVGWALGRNLFLTLNYTRTTDDEENEYEAALEWIPTRSLHVEVTTGDAGQSRIEVFKVWKF